VIFTIHKESPTYDIHLWHSAVVAHKHAIQEVARRAEY